MTSLMKHAAAAMIGCIAATTAWAGEASTSASATNGYGHPGAASATANYDGTGGPGFAQTRTDTTGGLSIGRGLAVGFDQDGLDVSFSHALAPQVGPAYAGTFNMSIGTNGQVSSSYGGTLAQGGSVRTAEAGGSTSSDWRGANAQAAASGNTAPGGRVDSWTQSNSSPAYGTPIVSRGRPSRGANLGAHAGRLPAGRPVAQGWGANGQGRRPISIQRSSLTGLRR